jgi:hypothetical protein
MEGGISRGTIDRVDVQGNEIARKFAEKFGGTYTQFLSPAVFSDKEVLDYFMNEKAVNYIRDEFKKLNVIVVGIGVPDGINHTLEKAGYVSGTEENALSAKYGLLKRYCHIARIGEDDGKAIDLFLVFHLIENKKIGGNYQKYVGKNGNCKSYKISSHKLGVIFTYEAGNDNGGIDNP